MDFFPDIIKLFYGHSFRLILNGYVWEIVRLLFIYSSENILLKMA